MYLGLYIYTHRLLRWLIGKESMYQCRRCKRCGFNPWVRKIPWSRTWQPTLVFLPIKSHQQRNLAGHNSWSRRVGHDWEIEHAPSINISYWVFIYIITPCSVLFHFLTNSLTHRKTLKTWISGIKSLMIRKGSQNLLILQMFLQDWLPHNN